MRVAVVILAAMFFARPVASADASLSRPVRVVVPNPVGGTVDLLARAIAKSASAAIAQSFVVENKPGGNTMIGTEAVVRAPADGHHLVMISTPFVLNALTRHTPYDALRDFAPVAGIASFPFVFAVHPSVPANSLEELVALAKATPGGLNYASFGVGQIVAETFKSTAGVDLTYVTYQGGVQATLSVVGGHVPLLVAPVSDVVAHVADGRLRGIAVSTIARSAVLPDLPTVAESGLPGFDWLGWIGIAAPAGTPPPTIARLSTAVLQAVALPETGATFQRLGIQATPMGADQFDRFVRSQFHKLDSAIRHANIAPEK